MHVERVTCFEGLTHLTSGLLDARAQPPQPHASLHSLHASDSMPVLPTPPRLQPPCLQPPHDRASSLRGRALSERRSLWQIYTAEASSVLPRAHAIPPVLVAGVSQLGVPIGRRGGRLVPLVGEQFGCPSPRPGDVPSRLLRRNIWEGQELGLRRGLQRWPLYRLAV